jgi:phosphatidylglycerol:prolipoprotein diacylglycerol transferase
MCLASQEETVRPVLFEIFGLPVQGFGVMITLGVAVAIWLTLQCLQEDGLKEGAGLNLLVASALAGYVGARLWAVGEGIARGDPVGDIGFVTILRYGGLTWYGGLLGGMVVFLLGSRMVGLPWRRGVNALAPGLAVGQAIGRIGCLLAGDDYGRPTDAWVGIAFPEGTPPTVVPVHPTMVYESAWLFVVGWWLWRRRESSPSVFGEYLLLAGGGRILIETLRLNPDFLGPLSNAQTIAATAMVVGAWMWISSRRLPETARSA